jgi:ribonuclease VapC
MLLEEPDRALLIDKIGEAESVGVAAPSLVEAGIVLSARLGSDASATLSELIISGDIVVIEFEADHWQEALNAWSRFGRGRHPAKLNFGDCLAYAAARVAGEPLLAKGDDFPQTDITLA